uniref:Bbp19-like phage domain-containing protein n=1 Tax=viral metagenome TaxID=1070528 RepID=A0A6M3K7K4_9ZZZZ
MNLTNIDEAKLLISHMRATFETPSGKEVLKYLEQSCGWYESIYDPVNKDRILVNAGRREVVATIKSFLELSPEQVVALVKQKE